MRIWDWALNWDQVRLPEGLASTCSRHQVHMHKTMRVQVHKAGNVGGTQHAGRYG